MVWIVSFLEFLLGSLMHFAYNVFPYTFVAILTPIHESIFEHLKLVLYPMLIFDIILWYKYYHKDLSAIAPMLIGIIVGCLSIVLIYYFYHCGLGVNSLIGDIFLLFVGILLGNIMMIMFYKFHWTMNWKVSLLILVSIIIIFSYWTYCPPDVPLFIDYS
ncbi:DUF6512 family protein [Candidatus Stoquefichus massiliensis]|uniref:DUF6512 family protein n=1 Tax=Candidatus Stoquefichus massiliensis TaxID=1470350 RepID=UPI0004853498|nr:DUF6512 family protein [Candidatus Stoquefichus massiliensis]